MNSLSLDGRTALVTGASAGIGRATAEALARAGAEVILVARRETRLRQLTQFMNRGSGKRHRYVVADLATDSGVGRLVDGTISRAGVDILVNNAGVSVPAPMGSPHSLWEDAFRVQFHAPRNLIEHFVPGMKERGFGRVINLGGTREPSDAPNASTAAKAALQVWAKAVSNQSASAGVTLNTVTPGQVETEQLDTVLHPDAEERDMFAHLRIPAKRYGQSVEVAELILFLASTSAAYITGAVIPIDGGLGRFAF